ncbi:toxic anion resistance protein, partial [Photobacterium sp. R1]
MEHMAGNLTEVIGLAKGVNIEALVGENNFFSKLISKVKNTKEKILAQFNSVNTQLERLVKEIDKQQSSLRERAHQL